MADLSIRPASECRFDAVSLGEVMLRLDPGEGRIRTARSFRAWEGGGEYNVARGLRGPLLKCPEGDLPTWDTHLRHLASALAAVTPGL
jgi:hypothetical protein